MSPHQERTNLVIQNKIWRFMKTKDGTLDKSFPRSKVSRIRISRGDLSSWRRYEGFPLMQHREDFVTKMPNVWTYLQAPVMISKKIGTKMSNDQDDISKTCCPSTCHSTAREGFQERQRQYSPKTVMILIFPWHVGYSSCFYHSGSSFSSCLFHEQMNRWCYVLHVFTD